MSVRLVLVPAAVLSLVLFAPGLAAAHIQPDPIEVPAGSTVTVGFTIQHGCDASPTVKVEIQVPDPIADVAPVAQDGWTGAVADRVVAYTGGPHDPDVALELSLAFTVPDAPGTELAFPVVQTCERGELAWISADPSDDYPAPIVQVGLPDPEAPTTTVVSATAEDSATTTTTSTTSTTVTATDDDDSTVGDDGSATPWVLGGVALAALVGAGVYGLRRRR